ncbi:MAG: urea ABC transporter permease subunit UrtB [Aquamicrobium sp.]|uniref:urea ABC transporter permease subunit UrtB n=1 Tax=Aquamicrobium sp. TaxID=1872579 RepID=UPI00349EAB81|nr:urea ABC transporter permease subunit UrtB [Aquamicrobium sp.]
MPRHSLKTLMFGLLLAIVAGLPARAQSVEELVRQLPDGSFSERGRVVAQLAATGDTRLVPLMEALAAGDLNAVRETGQVVLVAPASGSVRIADALTGEAAGEVARDAVERIRVNNSLRRAIRTALGQLTLHNPDRATRLAATRAMFQAADPENIPLLDAAIALEEDTSVRQAMEEAKAAAILRTRASAEDFAKAVDVIAARGGRASLGILTSALASAPDDARPAIESGIRAIESRLALLNVAKNVWHGLSLGSVLFLAAIGLAITFGVMGVINMAHGEMVMIGAYTTFVVQNIVRTSYPDLFDWSLAIALPAAFLVTALVGIAIERGVIRWLYGRPLETLLATWGLSLIIQQTVRSTFGASNREVGNPSWMSGSFDFYGIAITWNRFWIVLFSLAVFTVLLAIMKRTALGLQMRAVTQNRRMAASMGIRTPWIDAMTFGLGSGIAGLAGVALSQIDNVSPNLGQGYIIDSFMVVVFGGVGNLWGTFVGALTLGVVNKFLEPYAGAVLAKIFVLVFIILFIQKRPRGLFALKGRAVET